MGERICSIEDCVKPVKARGWCSAHHTAWLRHGNPLVNLKARVPTECVVDDCDREAASRGWCSSHYTAWRKYGDPLYRKWDHWKSKPCAVADCDAPAYCKGWCKNHYKRFMRYGDPLGWRDFSQTYGAVHQSLRKAQGLASDLACVDCGGAAQDWSYDNADPDELVSPEGMRYSTDLSHYQPRCKPCHRIFDRNP